MEETIRDRIKRRVRSLAAVAAVGWVICAVGMGLAFESSTHMPNFVLFFLGFVVFGGAIMGLQWLTRCPKCSTRIGQSIALQVAFGLFGSRPNYCPYCGVSLDERCP
ncbi:MAG TPA: hypothetical protein VMG11_09325 [Steroidobacteraceae bacterium]|nr:hypothetical protein [Steroidobacteraceae bacterium]